MGQCKIQRHVRGTDTGTRQGPPPQKGKCQMVVVSNGGAWKVGTKIKECVWECGEGPSCVCGVARARQNLGVGRQGAKAEGESCGAKVNTKGAKGRQGRHQRK